MVTPGVVFAFVGSLLFKFANSAAIDYEPIKIIVNENFNAQPGQVSSGLQALERGVLHQGANFYFKPQVNLPRSFIPSHLEALISFIQQHQNSDLNDPAAEKELMEILKPFMNPLSDISKETPPCLHFKKENNVEIVKPPEFIPSASEEIMAEPHPVPVVITEEPKLTELLVIPEAPILPPLSLSSIHSLTEEEMKNDKSAILEKQTSVYPTIPEITVRPIQEPIYNYVQAISEAQKGVFPTISGVAVRPIQESIINYDETESATSEIGPIPEAPVLTETDNSNAEETIISYVEPKPIITEIEVIPEAPVLPPLSVNDIKLVEEGLKIEEPTIVVVESKPAIEELEEVIPEAPVLSPLILQDVPSIIKEESIMLKEPTDVFPVIPEIAVRPVQEPIFNYVEPKPFITEFEAMPEAPVLPPLSASYIKLIEEGMKIKEPIVAQVESKPDIHELEEVVPEGLVLPSLSLHNVPYIVKEEVRKEESELLNEPRVFFPTVSAAAVRHVQEPVFDYVEPKPFFTELQDIPEAPVLPPLSANEIKLVEEGMKIEEPIAVEVESKPAIQELEKVIPEAPVLSRLVLQDVPSIVKEEVRKEESEILKVPIDVFPVVPEAPVRPEELTFNYGEPKPFISELQVIPEAPVLPPLSASYIKLIAEGMKIKEPIVAQVESKPDIHELEEVIPEAPALPPLSLHNVPYIVKEEVRKEESELLKEPTGVLTTVPEAAVRPVQEPVFDYVEPKPFFTELQDIPEAPVLPPLSANEIKLVEEGMKIEEPIVVEVESKPDIPELENVIPEAPTLPPLSLHDVPYIVKEEVRKEESKLLDEPRVVFPTVSAAAVRPVQELIFDYMEPKPFITEFQDIPEAPVLPPRSANDIKLVEEGMKSEEPIVVEVESKPAIQEFEKVIPEAPVLPTLSLYDFPYIVKEEVRKEESELLNEPAVVFPTVSEAAVRPQELIFNYVEPKPLISELQVIPEAPVLPPLSANEIKLVEEGMKIEEPIAVEVESKPAVQELEEVIEEAPVLSPLVLQNVPSIIKEESIMLKEPTDVFPVIPEIAVRPVQEPIFNYVEPKPFITEFEAMPEAPVLPPLSASYIKLIAEGMEIKEPIVAQVESKPDIHELEEVIPEAPVLPSLSLHDVPFIVKEEVRKEESELLKEPTGVLTTVPEAAVRPVQELVFDYVEPKPFFTGLQAIPEAPVLPPLSANEIKLVEEGMKIEEPITVEVESKPAVQEIEEVIEEAPVLSPLVLQNVPSIIKEESIILNEPTDVSPIIPEIAVRPVQEPIFNYVEPKSFITEFQVIPEAPVLPLLSANDIKIVEEGMKIEEPIVVDVDSKPTIQELEEVIPDGPSLSFNGLPSVDVEVKTEELVKVEESTDMFPEISARPISGPITVLESGKHFALENNNSPVATKVNIEIPILLEESIEVFPPIAERPLGPTLDREVQTNSYILEEVSQPKPKYLVPVKESFNNNNNNNNLRLFNYAPFVTHFSNHAAKAKKLTIPKPASLERFLLKKNQFRLPVMSFPKLSLNAMKSSIGKNKKQFVYPTSYAHDVVEKRIAPNMGFKNYAPPKHVRIYMRSQVPKGPSHL